MERESNINALNEKIKKLFQYKQTFVNYYNIVKKILKNPHISENKSMDQQEELRLKDNSKRTLRIFCLTDLRPR